LNNNKEYLVRAQAYLDHLDSGSLTFSTTSK
jgi:hypothetical protein